MVRKPRVNMYELLQQVPEMDVINRAYYATRGSVWHISHNGKPLCGNGSYYGYDHSHNKPTCLKCIRKYLKSKS